MSIHDGHAITRSRDAQRALLLQHRSIPRQGTQDLARLVLELILLARDEGHDVIEDVHGADARVSGSGDGLHRDDGGEVDGAEGGLQGGEGHGYAYDGAVGVADEEALGEGAGLALVGDEVEVVEVDGGDDEGHVGVLAVVFGVGEDCEAGVLEFGFCPKGGLC